MPRRPRDDYEGAWHHLVNRGIARRPVFEGGGDIRAFQDLLAEATGTGRIEIHAYTFMATHYHLLARSPEGELSVAMKEVGNAYVRRFNRGRHRDGPLFRGRFWSRPVESDAYFHTLLRYIDRNPVQAGLVERSTDYPHGSAWWYARGGGPPFLVRGAVEEFLGMRDVRSGSPARAYPVETRDGAPSFVDEMVERRIRGAELEEDPLRDLVRSPPDRVQAWMLRKTRLADGSTPGWVIVPEARIRADPAGDQDLRIAMVRLYCGLTVEETASRFSLSTATVSRRVARHLERMEVDAAYRDLASGVLWRALEGEFGGIPSRSVLPLRVLHPEFTPAV
ncbi:MAG: transposase [Planctomycetaceae bacterium]|nr:transposase [Planctomycetota bacterium]NUN53518.1 transposase [Planctomycetaceae bacterium]